MFALIRPHLLFNFNRWLYSKNSVLSSYNINLNSQNGHAWSISVHCYYFYEADVKDIARFMRFINFKALVWPCSVKNCFISLHTPQVKSLQTSGHIHTSVKHPVSVLKAILDCFVLPTVWEKLVSVWYEGCLLCDTFGFLASHTIQIQSRNFCSLVQWKHMKTSLKIHLWAMDVMHGLLFLHFISSKKVNRHVNVKLLVCLFSIIEGSRIN